jgi:hypothetical protein
MTVHFAYERPTRLPCFLQELSSSLHQSKGNSFAKVTPGLSESRDYNRRDDRARRIRDIFQVDFDRDQLEDHQTDTLDQFSDGVLKSFRRMGHVSAENSKGFDKEQESES